GSGPCRRSLEPSSDFGRTSPDDRSHRLESNPGLHSIIPGHHQGLFCFSVTLGRPRDTAGRETPPDWPEPPSHAGDLTSPSGLVDQQASLVAGGSTCLAARIRIVAAPSDPLVIAWNRGSC